MIREGKPKLGKSHHIISHSSNRDPAADLAHHLWGFLISGEKGTSSSVLGRDPPLNCGVLKHDWCEFE